MNRRNFAKNSIAGLASVSIASGLIASSHAHTKHGKPFKLNYAPGFRHFRNHVGNDFLKALDFMHENGFRAIEDNRMPTRPVEDQIAIGEGLRKRKMTMGVFVTGFGMETRALTGNKPDPNERKRDLPAVRAMLEETCLKAVETAKRVDAKWTTIVCGAEDPSLDYGYQFQNLVDNLRFCADIFEPHGIVMVLEPLNRMNHPGLFLKYIPQAYTICKSINSPSCKILDDLYHQQISEGNLIPNMDQAWDEIVYIQVGDNPGRKEPTTGEINYKNIFKHLYKKGYKGIVGMEHGISRQGIEGEKRLLEAYREVDDFEV